MASRSLSKKIWPVSITIFAETQASNGLYCLDVRPVQTYGPSSGRAQVVEINRRDWIQAVLTGAVGLAAGKYALAQAKSSILLPPIQSTFNGVIIGCNTYSMTRLSLDEAVQAIAAVGIGVAELHPCHIEPSFGHGAGANKREKLRQWRLTAPLEEFQIAGKKFRAAGVHVYAYNMNFPTDDFSEAEIERTFEMTKALGAQIMVPAVGTSATILRLDPIAKKHQIRYGIHNEESIRTPQDFDRIRKGLSDYAAITLDIGHFVASGSDPIDYLNKHQDDIVNLHIKDRRRHNGAIVPFGEGDTPIKEVLSLLRERKYLAPAAIEYENKHVAPAESLRAAFEYCRQALL
jgi:sugar phosphate isomerase/epimerase